MKEAKFDKSAYAEKTFEEADRNVKYWRSRPWWERLQAGYHMSLRAYGYDPKVDDPKIDTSIFKIIKSDKKPS